MLVGAGGERPPTRMVAVVVVAVISVNRNEGNLNEINFKVKFLRPAAGAYMKINVQVRFSRQKPQKPQKSTSGSELSTGSSLRRFCV